MDGEAKQGDGSIKQNESASPEKLIESVMNSGLSPASATGETSSSGLDSGVGVDLGSEGSEVAVAIIEQIDELPTTLEGYRAYQRDMLRILSEEGCYGERYEAHELVCKRWNASLLAAFAYGVDSPEFQSRMAQFQSGRV
jgi:hypothetical protein